MKICEDLQVSEGGSAVYAVSKDLILDIGFLASGILAHNCNKITTSINQSKYMGLALELRLAASRLRICPDNGLACVV